MVLKGPMGLKDPGVVRHKPQGTHGPLWIHGASQEPLRPRAQGPMNEPLSKLPCEVHGI